MTAQSSPSARAEAFAEQGSPLYLLGLDQSLQILSADRRFAQAFSFDGELVGRRLDELFSPSDRLGVADFYGGLTRYQSGFLDVLVSLRLGSADHHTRLRMRLEGQSWLAFIEPVGGPGCAVHNLLLSREWWRTVVRDATDGIAVVAPDTRIVEHNPRFLELLRPRSTHGVALSEESIAGKPLFERVAGSSFAPVEEAMRAAKPRSRRFSGRIVHGNLHLQVSLTPILVPARGFTGCSLVLRDLTAEEEVAQLRARIAREAGMSEVATGVLHNVGNALNSVNVSSQVLAEMARASKAQSLGKAAAMFEEHQGDLGAFLTGDPKGQRLPGFLKSLAAHLQGEREALLQEVSKLQQNVEHIKSIIAAQQTYSRSSLYLETLSLRSVVDTALAVNVLKATRSDIRVVVECGDFPQVELDRHRVLQILVNLLSNARHAVQSAEKPVKEIRVKAELSGNLVRVSVADNGAGVPDEARPRIFEHGFTTKKSGHGFGLHSSAIAAREMGGSLTFHSDGPGQGATFILEVPVRCGARAAEEGGPR
ncbi:MAG: PAS domain-containing sensor histidine kinase [Myxococcales bacterium]|nr:PAS domain-containing sensor histidine kinase [Myxococcales bacterium]